MGASFFDMISVKRDDVIRRFRTCCGKLLQQASNEIGCYLVRFSVVAVYESDTDILVLKELL
jgi:hypothetical protein